MYGHPSGCREHRLRKKNHKPCETNSAVSCYKCGERSFASRADDCWSKANKDGDDCGDCRADVEPPVNNTARSASRSGPGFRCRNGRLLHAGSVASFAPRHKECQKGMTATNTNAGPFHRGTAMVSREGGRAPLHWRAAAKCREADRPWRQP